ncbi:DUF4159 domain-containing protein [Falsirhodobacter algicola]|uniref:DUF4159 domain-containing protein n=1 Tax=Falsirhodobacter algicola TaxID=2692330 RepID=A0A8J8MUI3_9RHOB|nr:DUF4159 domain-containing protein [Falsirhodobacter algicola]QUS36975.1 DUF4159 domain-containing protein [Falsirhodobacter algicola]
MWTLGPIGFTAPLVLLGLVLLPLLWVLLRAVPPAPVRRRFPGVALLLGLTDRETAADRTPWWLMALRMAALGAVILGFAGPVLNPAPGAPDDTPLLVVVDGSWADAPDWPRRIARAEQAMTEAGRADAPVALIRATEAPASVSFRPAEAVIPQLRGAEPNPWAPRFADWAAALPEGPFRTLWLSDGIDHPGRADLVAALEDRGALTVIEVPNPLVALRPPALEGEGLRITAARLPVFTRTTADVQAIGADPSGAERELGRLTLDFPPNAAEATGVLTLPPEMRNRVTRLQVAGMRSAASVQLADDALRRREVALIGDAAPNETAQLLSPLFYLHRALEPSTDLIEGRLQDMLPANPDVIVLAGTGQLAPAEAADLQAWVEGGGLLLRFAGPRMAARPPAADDPLMTVRLRAGGRALGGAMSWGEPRRLAPFEDGSPFAGLSVPSDVTVTEQVLAEPAPDLADRTLAALEDGTPLVTRKALGQGQVVLFHVTANAEWSNLPLSGLFVQMLERLTVVAGRSMAEPADLAGTVWTPERLLDAFGTAGPPGAEAGIEGAALATTPLSAALRPGLYDGGGRQAARNVLLDTTPLEAAVWPDGQAVADMDAAPARALKGPLLALALAALLIDVLAALAVGGRLRRGAAMAIAGLVMLTAPPEAQAQDDRAIAAVDELRLAFVRTGDAEVDRISEAGLRGLSLQLASRTSVEPGEPMGVDPATDELAFFPFLYWPVTGQEAGLSAAATERVNAYLRTGGMILFDTRDADMAGLSGGTEAGRALQRLTAGLDIPPLEPVPSDHVLTRTFYLLQDFPGRQVGPVWVEAAAPEAEAAGGQPFRTLNDGVTPVIIGGNDWAAAWASDAYGAPLLPVGRGYGGERQREIAVRFGINVVMYVLTGNYKNDQVHVPALLERLGN